MILVNREQLQPGAPLVIKTMRKNAQRVIPIGRICPRNLLLLGNCEEKQIPRFARDDKMYFSRGLKSLFNLV
jgi:hypothetical protein